MQQRTEREQLRNIGGCGRARNDSGDRQRPQLGVVPHLGQHRRLPLELHVVRWYLRGLDRGIVAERFDVFGGVVGGFGRFEWGAERRGIGWKRVDAYGHRLGGHSNRFNGWESFGSRERVSVRRVGWTVDLSLIGGVDVVRSIRHGRHHLQGVHFGGRVAVLLRLAVFLQRILEG